MTKAVRVYAPATVANVAAGFDILGFAVNAPGDDVVARVAGPGGVRITAVSGGDGSIPTDPTKNTAGVSVLRLLEHLGSDVGIELELSKNMPLGSGLGSSAASAVASVVAANEVLGAPLTRRELLPFAMEAERIACGTGHADNVAPALLGGFLLIRSYRPLDTVRIPAPSELVCTLLHPHIEIRTEDARRILKSKITMRAAVEQWGNTAGLIAGLLTGDYGLIGRSLTDVIVEPARSILIPCFTQAKEAALHAGALGCSISGSGPSMFVLSRGRETAAAAGEAMTDVYRAAGIACDVFVSEINPHGAVVID
jgi:homoserine kinase